MTKNARPSAGRGQAEAAKPLIIARMAGFGNRPDGAEVRGYGGYGGYGGHKR